MAAIARRAFASNHHFERDIVTLAPWLFSATLLVTGFPVLAQEGAVALTMDAVNAARLESLVPPPLPQPSQEPEAADLAKADRPDPGMVRLQILLDQAGASPGVIDGFDGENVRKAVAALETLHGLEADGELDPDIIRILETGEPVLLPYTISPEDEAAVVGPVPEDYAELAGYDHLGFATIEEGLAEKFHMDIDLLKALNPGSTFATGEQVIVAQLAEPLQGEVARIEADKRLGQLRAYDKNNKLVVAYPATVGSDDNPSPAGIHTVTAIAPEPTYTYNPEINFQQGNNDEVLELAAGPNNPVGTVWIDLSEPTYGIHGTPEPSEIDKTASHGCVRLTNWDAEELAGMVEKGVSVKFIQ
jgi:lipoprotein-anchoring transpeptidase ErfK/SrfK